MAMTAARPGLIRAEDIPFGRRLVAFCFVLIFDFFYGWSWNTVDLLRPDIRAAFGLGLADVSLMYTAQSGGALIGAVVIGQLADPAYPRKLAALYCEFRETGVAERLGYRDPADLAEQYPRFFWGKVEPHIGPALRHLERTVDGRLWVAQLYAHVFVEEHVRHRLGTERGGGAAGELRVVSGEAEPPIIRHQMSN